MLNVAFYTFTTLTLGYALDFLEKHSKHTPLAIICYAFFLFSLILLITHTLGLFLFI